MGKPGSRREIYLIYFVLIAITVAIYWQAAEFSFINVDDKIYVISNPVVADGLTPTSVLQAFLPYPDNWIPLVWISYMVDNDLGTYVLGSTSPAVYHTTNVALHLANTLLLFLVLLRMTGSRWRSAFVAALFAVHPLHVESVAWIAERKDVLSTLFWLLTMLAYVRYAQRVTTKRYALVVLLFALGLMAKPMLVTLPICLLLLDYWPLRRMGGRDGEPGATWGGFRDMVSEKMSLFVLSVAGCLITLWAQKSISAVGTLTEYPIGVRIANALVAYVAYILKMVWPTGLTFFYAHPGDTLPVWKVVGSAALLVALTALAIRAGRKRPYITVGWLWYLITLVPVIGIVQVGWQAMADRYTYVPLIGLFVALAWGVSDLIARWPPTVSVRRYAGVAAVAVIAALAILAYKQVSYWQDDYELCRHAIQVDYNNPMAHQNMGFALMDQGDVRGAVREFRVAVRLRPRYITARYNLGNALAELGDYDGAIAQYRAALRYDPTLASPHQNLGALLARQGKLAEAIEEFREALRLDPNDQNARLGLQHALEEQSQRSVDDGSGR